ncbi:hypothetical protein BLNAU_9473 [Blattamonas nauphoetae]|uniref:Uncharacterized protein n=1 Tax=Blattamonas nauphoetae TaxID=2049346 RepID=A0ABQ9XVW3_9EUKA|nr:hypothetical protein BLNAU_9473 [Blattamonas nauphoetae]
MLEKMIQGEDDHYIETEDEVDSSPESSSEDLPPIDVSSDEEVPREDSASPNLTLAQLAEKLAKPKAVFTGEDLDSQTLSSHRPKKGRVFDSSRDTLQQILKRKPRTLRDSTTNTLNQSQRSTSSSLWNSSIIKPKAVAPSSSTPPLVPFVPSTQSKTPDLLEFQEFDNTNLRSLHVEIHELKRKLRSSEGEKEALQEQLEDFDRCNEQLNQANDRIKKLLETNAQLQFMQKEDTFRSFSGLASLDDRQTTRSLGSGESIVVPSTFRETMKMMEEDLTRLMISRRENEELISELREDHETIQRDKEELSRLVSDISNQNTQLASSALNQKDEVAKVISELQANKRELYITKRKNEDLEGELLTLQQELNEVKQSNTRRGLSVDSEALYIRVRTIGEELDLERRRKEEEHVKAQILEEELRSAREEQMKQKETVHLLSHAIHRIAEQFQFDGDEFGKRGVGRVTKDLTVFDSSTFQLDALSEVEEQKLRLLFSDDLDQIIDGMNAMTTRRQTSQMDCVTLSSTFPDFLAIFSSQLAVVNEVQSLRSSIEARDRSDETTFAEIKTKTARLEGRSLAATAEKEMLEKKIKKMETEYTTTIIALQRERDALLQSETELKVKLENRETASNKREQHLSTIRKQLSEREVELELTSDELSTTKKDLAQLRSKCNALEEQLSEKDAHLELIRRNTKTDTHDKMTEKRERKLKEREEQILQAEEALRRKEKEMETMENELQMMIQSTQADIDRPQFKRRAKTERVREKDSAPFHSLQPVSPLPPISDLRIILDRLSTDSTVLNSASPSVREKTLHRIHEDLSTLILILWDDLKTLDVDQGQFRSSLSRPSNLTVRLCQLLPSLHSLSQCSDPIPGTTICEMILLASIFISVLEETPLFENLPRFCPNGIKQLEGGYFFDCLSDLFSSAEETIDTESFDSIISFMSLIEILEDTPSVTLLGFLISQFAIFSIQLEKDRHKSRKSGKSPNPVQSSPVDFSFDVTFKDSVRTKAISLLGKGLVPSYASTKKHQPLESGYSPTQQLLSYFGLIILDVLSFSPAFVTSTASTTIELVIGSLSFVEAPHILDHATSFLSRLIRQSTTDVNKILLMENGCLTKISSIIRIVSTVSQGLLTETPKIGTSFFEVPSTFPQQLRISMQSMLIFLSCLEPRSFPSIRSSNTDVAIVTLLKAIVDNVSPRDRQGLTPTPRIGQVGASLIGFYQYTLSSIELLLTFPPIAQSVLEECRLIQIVLSIDEIRIHKSLREKTLLIFEQVMNDFSLSTRSNLPLSLVSGHMFIDDSNTITSFVALIKEFSPQNKYLSRALDVLVKILITRIVKTQKSISSTNQNQEHETNVQLSTFIFSEISVLVDSLQQRTQDTDISGLIDSLDLALAALTCFASPSLSRKIFPEYHHSLLLNNPDEPSFEMYQSIPLMKFDEVFLLASTEQDDSQDKHFWTPQTVATIVVDVLSVLISIIHPLSEQTGRTNDDDTDNFIHTTPSEALSKAFHAIVSLISIHQTTRSSGFASSLISTLLSNSSSIPRHTLPRGQQSIMFSNVFKTITTLKPSLAKGTPQNSASIEAILFVASTALTQKDYSLALSCLSCLVALMEHKSSDPTLEQQSYMNAFLSPPLLRALFQFLHLPIASSSPSPTQVSMKQHLNIEVVDKGETITQLFSFEAATILTNLLRHLQNVLTNPTPSPIPQLSAISAIHQFGAIAKELLYYISKQSTPLTCSCKGGPQHHHYSEEHALSLLTITNSSPILICPISLHEQSIRMIVAEFAHLIRNPLLLSATHPRHNHRNSPFVDLKPSQFADKTINSAIDTSTHGSHLLATSLLQTILIGCSSMSKFITNGIPSLFSITDSSGKPFQFSSSDRSQSRDYATAATSLDYLALPHPLVVIFNQPSHSELIRNYQNDPFAKIDDKFVFSKEKQAFEECELFCRIWQGFISVCSCLCSDADATTIFLNNDGVKLLRSYLFVRTVLKRFLELNGYTSFSSQPDIHKDTSQNMDNIQRTQELDSHSIYSFESSTLFVISRISRNAEGLVAIVENGLHIFAGSLLQKSLLALHRPEQSHSPNNIPTHCLGALTDFYYSLLPLLDFSKVQEKKSRKSSRVFTAEMYGAVLVDLVVFKHLNALIRLVIRKLQFEKVKQESELDDDEVVLSSGQVADIMNESFLLQFVKFISRWIEAEQSDILSSYQPVIQIPSIVAFFDSRSAPNVPPHITGSSIPYTNMYYVFSSIISQTTLSTTLRQQAKAILKKIDVILSSIEKLDDENYNSLFEPSTFSGISAAARKIGREHENEIDLDELDWETDDQSASQSSEESYSDSESSIQSSSLTSSYSSNESVPSQESGG